MPKTATQLVRAEFETGIDLGPSVSVASFDKRMPASVGGVLVERGGKLILLAIFTKLVAPASSEKVAIEQISRLLDMFENAESEQS